MILPKKEIFFNVLSFMIPDPPGQRSHSPETEDQSQKINYDQKFIHYPAPKDVRIGKSFIKIKKIILPESSRARAPAIKTRKIHFSLARTFAFGTNNKKFFWFFLIHL